MVEELNGIEKNHDAAGMKEIWEKAGYDPLRMIAPPGADRKLLSQTITQRSLSLAQSAPIIYEEVKNIFGEKDPRSIALRVFNDLGENFNEIAVSQIESFDPENPQIRSWRSYNTEASERLEAKINSSLTNEQYTSFWQENPEFAESLIIISGRLIDESSQEGFALISEDLESLNLKALENKRLFFVLFPYNDFYLDPNRKSASPPNVWEVNTQLLFSLPDNIGERVSAIDENASNRMASIFHLEPLKTPACVGNAVIGFGTETLSLTTGQALGTGFEPSPKGFELALNLLEKKRRAWEKGQTVFQNDTDFSKILDDLIFLYFSHERGHELDRKIANQKNGDSRILDEVRTDIPSVIALFEKKLESASEGTTSEHNDGLDDSIRLVFSLLASEITETTEDDKDLNKGYRISASFVLNELLKSGLIIKNGQETHLGISSDETKVATFLNSLKEIHAKIMTNDPETLESLKKVVIDLELEQVVEEFKDNL